MVTLCYVLIVMVMSRFELSELRAKAASPKGIKTYFEKLTDIDLEKYNVNERGINTGGLKPPNIVTVKGSKAQVVTSTLPYPTPSSVLLDPNLPFEKILDPRT